MSLLSEKIAPIAGVTLLCEIVFVAIPDFFLNFNLFGLKEYEMIWFVFLLDKCYFRCWNFILLLVFRMSSRKYISNCSPTINFSLPIEIRKVKLLNFRYLIVLSKGIVNIFLYSFNHEDIKGALVSHLPAGLKTRVARSDQTLTERVV